MEKQPDQVDATTSPVTMEKLVALAKRRGFVYPGSDIYGGLANTWDYGPLGSEVRRNIRNAWWERFVQRRPDIYGIEGSIFLHTRTWEASGHVEKFFDPMVDCRNCRSRYRADDLIERRTGLMVEGKSVEEMSQVIAEHKIACPNCGQRDWTPVREFNLMFRTTLGPVEAEGTPVFLRPETAQAIFLDYKNVLDTMRVKIPFGLAQIGRAFRNEITPGNFIFRLLEFEQMEIEYFIRPEEWEPRFEEWLRAQLDFYTSLGIRAEHLRAREHQPEEMSHYSKRTVDYEYLYPFGWKELSGLAYRTDFDLRNHQEASGVDLTYHDPLTNERFLPHVIEPTVGVDRLMLVTMLDAYAEEDVEDVNGKAYKRVVMRFDPKVAPFKVAVLPLMRKPELTAKAAEVYELLRDELPA
ncbi:MAG TPA: glycine--tRNA ligase, partial [Thermomicrobiaceae bacterium]|nr:glycine--tRNA ligase [Thermomicrobiaceae bacterium]